MRKQKKFEIDHIYGNLASGWEVTVLVDDDGHLNVYIENQDKTNIEEIETGQGTGKNGEQLALRFTTHKIEKDYDESMGDYYEWLEQRELEMEIGVEEDTQEIDQEGTE